MSIIVEGPDGAGKTTLIQELQFIHPGLEIHPRFCTSTGGPIDNLAEAVFRDIDVVARPTNQIYDRHPVISEYIYRTAIDISGGPADVFLSDQMKRVRERIARHSLVIWCLPPFQTVFNNVIEDDAAGGQMSGVLDNIHQIYNLYQQHRIFWPGRYATVFDYTRHDASWEGLRHALTDSYGRLWKETSE